MATTSNLGATLLEVGQTQKEPTLNDLANLLDASVAGSLSKSIAGLSTYTLTSTEARNALIILQGALTANCELLIPVGSGTGRNRKPTIWNLTTGAFTVTIKTTASGSAGVPITQNYARDVFHNDVNVYGSAEYTPGSSSGLNVGLVASWKLGEASGTRSDSVGSNHLTDNNTVTQAAGKIGNAAQFTIANSEYLSVADNLDLSTGDIDFTIALWVYLDAKATSQILVGKLDATAGNKEYQVFYDQSIDRFRFSVATPTDVDVLVSASTFGSPTAATWYLIIAWHDATANTINISVNNGATDSAATGGALQASGTAEFDLGRRSFSGSNLYFGGRLDAVDIWKRLLTAGEKTELWNSSVGREHPF